MKIPPYHTQKWPFEVMHQALRIRAQGHSIRGTAAKLAETVHPAPSVNTVAKWCDRTIIRAARIQENYPMPKLVWRESGHLSDQDAGYAICGAPVRFQDVIATIPQADACAACLLRAEGAGREFSAPVRAERRRERADGQMGIGLSGQE